MVQVLLQVKKQRMAKHLVSKCAFYIFDSVGRMDERTNERTFGCAIVFMPELCLYIYKSVHIFHVVEYFAGAIFIHIHFSSLYSAKSRLCRQYKMM